jgi:iron complex outermembrane recepter protein
MRRGSKINPATKMVDALTLRPVTTRVKIANLMNIQQRVICSILLGPLLYGRVVWPAAAEDLAQLKKLELDDLLKLEVTSPGKKLEPWFFAPTAIEVLTSEDIRRYGATTIADTVRLVPGLNVGRNVGNSYAISARGFNGPTANKMQVLMDGRSIYTPFFSGVFWEVQDTLLEDLDRIEVVRGPGATLWGANAVNGVINIISKSARDTQGLLMMGGGGNEELGFGGLRYGAKVSESTYYRVYSKYRYRDQQIFSSGIEAEDFSEHWQAGFRSDSYFRDVHQLTMQGDFYLNDFGAFGRDDSHAQGGNVLSRWTRTFSETSSLQFQVYYDRSERSVPLSYSEDRDTIDADIQHQFQLGERNNLVWGGNYRFSADATGTDGTFQFSPAEKSIHEANIFVQDEISLIPERLKLSLGSKLGYNDYTGVEVQPSGRISFIPTSNQVVWAGVSRAVRTPSRLESDTLFKPIPTGSLVTLRGNPDFRSEDLVAYEIGYRVQPVPAVSLEASSFYNVYNNLRTIEPSPTTFPFVLGNERHGETYGLELVARYHPQEWWHLMASYTWLHEELRFSASSRDPTGGSSEANDPEHMGRLRSNMSLPHNIEFDQVLRYVDQLPNPRVPSYVELDLRVGWRPKPGLELSIVGANLLDSSHPEFGGSSLQPEVQRSVYAKITWHF